MSLEEILKLSSDLQPFPLHKAHEVDAGVLNPFEDQRANEGQGRRDTNGTGTLFEEFERTKGLESQQNLVGVSDTADSSLLLIAHSIARGKDVDQGHILGEVNDIMVTDEMSYDAVILPVLPPEGKLEGQEPHLEFTEPYLSSPGGRDAVLISTVPGPSSPSTYFQASTIDVGGSNSAAAATWGDLQSIQEESGYGTLSSSEDASPGGGRITESGALSRTDKAAIGALSLRGVLSDPITGAFMDDAMVAICGHSFGSGGLQRVLETRLCASCGACIVPATLVPNFALRAAVLAYKNENQLWQLQSSKVMKRSRDEFEIHEDFEPKGVTKSQEQEASAEFNDGDGSRPKGVQFPFAVNDRVLIKGNKRTPDRFVGMEAVITSQCLNGWYLVRTLDTAESVRLQYRSLKKLGEMNASEAENFAKRCSDVCGSALGVDSPAGCLSGLKSTNEFGLKPGPFSSLQDTAVAISACSPINPNDLKACSSERESSVPLEKLVELSEHERSPNPNGSLHITSEQRLSDQGQISENGTTLLEDLSQPLQNGDDYSSGNLGVSVQEGYFDVPQISGNNEVNNTSSNIGESYDDQLLHTGLHHKTRTDVWIGTGIGGVETRPSNLHKEPQQAIHIAAGEAVLELTEVEKHQPNGHEFTRTRSKRTAQHFKTSSLPEDFIRDTDPYRKVYSSGSRRRSGKLAAAATVPPDGLKSSQNASLNVSSPVEKCLGKPSGKGSNMASACGSKQVRDMTLKSSNEILQIMRKDMLKLEKQIPRNYLLRLWRARRSNWRKRVRDSHTVSELGACVRDFRYSLLLTNAGDMSDEEWEMRIALIIDSGDIELLVSLWGRLYTDVYKWLESRPRSVTGKDGNVGLAPGDDTHGGHQLDSALTGQLPSAVKMTTSAALAAIDAIANSKQDADSSIKALLASTTELLHQQSIAELSAFREALEREKRHITAKLAHLEGTFGNLRWSLEPNGVEDESVCQRASETSPSGQILPTATLPAMEGTSSDTSSKQSDDGEEGESESALLRQDPDDSDTAIPRRDPDGEATDMSDSD